MFTFKLKRRMSGRRIRKAIREEELRPTVVKKTVDPITEEVYVHTYKSDPHRFNRMNNIYWKNTPQKRRRENPTLYKGEIWTGYGTLRQPKKCRKTAWKRYQKIKEQVEQRTQPKALPLPW